MSRTVSILGATGSIGRSTVRVLESQDAGFSVESIAGGRDVVALAGLAKRLRVKFAAIADPDAYSDLRDALSGTGISCGAGDAAVLEAAERPADIVVAGISGTAGVRPTHAAVRLGRTVAVANKECLVCAGHAFMRDAVEAGARLLPMDSEHNAIFQALGGSDACDVEQMILTASGGPFRIWPADRIANARPEEALAHPNWTMGAKVTIDSASLMNKGLELIEAQHLFSVQANRLAVLVHPQSIVHGLVTFQDGSVTAGLASPDMCIPIAHCLGFPDRLRTAAPRLDLVAIGKLDFEAPDLDRFPALGLAFDALRSGGAMATVLNAANEVAVEAFLARMIPFGAIASSVEKTMHQLTNRYGYAPPNSIDEALLLDREARHIARDFVGSAVKTAD